MTRLLLGAIAAATAGSLPAFLLGGLAVQVQHELQFGEARHGLAFGAFFAAAALSSIGLGRATERWGAVPALRVGTVTAGVTQLGIAGAARSWGGLTVLLACAGVATSLIQPAANLLLARAIPEQRQGLAFGIKQSAIPVATLLGGLAVPAFALTVGWRFAFVAGGGFAFLAAGLVPRRTAVRVPVAEDTSPRTEMAAPAVLASLAVGIGFGAAAATSLGSFVVSSGVRAGLDEGVAGLALSVGSILGIAVRLMLGRLADSRIRDPFRVVVWLLISGSAAFAMLALQLRWLHLAATMLAFGGGWAWPGLFNFAVVRSSPGKPGAATGITQTGTYIGGVGGPLIFGMVAAHGSYSLAWLLVAAFAVIAAVAVSTGRRCLARTESALPV